MRIRSNDRSRAFTLVELLVVIGIIAVLIGVLLPVLGRARKAANTAKCLTTVRQLSIAWNLYSQTFKGRSIPYYDDQDATSLWIGQLRSVYSRIDDSRLCVEATAPSQLQYTWGSCFSAWGPNGFQFLVGQSGSYGFNGFLYWFGKNNSRGFFWSPNPADDGKFFRFPVKRSAEVPVFFDSAWCDVWIHPNDSAPPDLISASVTNIGEEMWRVCIARHGKAINIAYADGHAETVPLGKLWNQRWHAMYVPPKTSPKLPDR
jgi:prepilin-type processing-associated H-X9-DG protein/prepilin-type N-terminal cleavage/methylation domain-containing protein